MLNTKRTTAALFVIAIASSLIVASGFVGFAFAAKKGHDSATNTSANSDEESRDNSNENNNNSNPTSSNSSPNPDDSGTSSNDNTNSDPTQKALNLWKCMSGRTTDDNPRLATVRDCYRQAFGNDVLGQGTPDQSASKEGIGLPNIG
jgi:cytoskeletal protein RodZ